MISPDEAENKLIADYESTIDNNLISGNFHIRRKCLQRHSDVPVNYPVLLKVLEKYRTEGWEIWETSTWTGYCNIHYIRFKKADVKNTITQQEKLPIALVVLGWAIKGKQFCPRS